MKSAVVGVLAMGGACGLLVAACSSDDHADTSSSASGGTADVSLPDSGEGAPTVDAGQLSTDIQLIGRFDMRDPTGPACAWPGCRILARFEGSSVSVDLEELDESWMDGAPSEWDVSVDHVWKDKLVTAPGRKTYPIATGLLAGEHEVELYKRSEAQNGITRFSRFDFGGGKLLPPPPRSDRRIEIIGDSSAAGLGIEGLDFPDNDCPGIDYSARWQNYRASFGALLGSELGAEVHGTVFSGKGIVKNIWRLDTESLPVLFPLTNPIDPSSTYDFAWKPDVVVLMIGGNDFAVGEPDENAEHGPATPAEFLAAYRAFVGTLRDRYPTAHLYLAVSASVSDDDPPGRNTRTNIATTVSTITSERNAAGDPRVHTFSPAPAASTELNACNGHGSPALHTRIAGELRTLVKQTTGW